MLLVPIRYALYASVLTLPLALCCPGCGTSAGNDGTKQNVTAGAQMTGGGCCGPRVTQAAGSCCSGMNSEVSAELAKLSPADRALAEKQKTCPVTDAPLGSMGVPVKVTVQGRAVLLCCDACQEKLNKNADEYLAKLDRAETK